MLKAAFSNAAPARSPTRPPIGSILWVVGWGSGPVPRNSRSANFQTVSQPIIPERNQRRMAGSRLRSQPQTLQRQFCTPEESTVNLREAT